MDQEVK